MDYQKWICEKLMKIYEKRDVLKTGVFSNKKIKIDIYRNQELKEKLERLEEGNLFLEAVNSLKRRGAADFSWLNDKEGTVIEKVWLVPKPEAVKECFKILGRMPPGELALQFQKDALSSAQTMSPDSDIRAFLEKLAKKAGLTAKIPRFFSKDDFELNNQIFKALVAIGSNRDEILERVLSIKLYSDSKRFEHDIKSKVLSVLREIKKENSNEPFADEELLQERGVVKSPEIFPFSGRVKIFFRNKEAIDFSPLTHGAYINSESAKEIERVEGQGIRQVTFIENMANYVDCVSKNTNSHELFIFHGGFYSPMKGRFFKILYDSFKEKVSFRHRSDIDLGGFRIFVRLQKEIVPSLIPDQMDIQTLEKFKSRGRPLGSKEYENELRKLLDDTDYEIFHPVIKRMLQLKLKLEQEALLA